MCNRIKLFLLCLILELFFLELKFYYCYNVCVFFSLSFALVLRCCLCSVHSINCGACLPYPDSAPYQNMTFTIILHLLLLQCLVYVPLKKFVRATIFQIDKNIRSIFLFTCIYIRKKEVVLIYSSKTYIIVWTCII